MKRWFAAMVSAAVLFSASSALAGAVLDTKFALHVKNTTKNTKSQCTTWSPVPPDSTWGTSPPTPCDNFVTSADLGITYYVYLVIAETNDAGIAGISCGVQYGTGLAVSGWNRCSDLEFPSGAWPAPGGGNRITWAPQTNCQRKQPTDGTNPGSKVTAVAGWFYLTSYYNYLIPNAMISLTPNYNVPVPEVAFVDCSASETQLAFNHVGHGVINMGTGGPLFGCNPYLGPCEEPVAVRSTTWGRIKNLGTD